MLELSVYSAFRYLVRKTRPEVFSYAVKKILAQRRKDAENP